MLIIAVSWIQRQMVMLLNTFKGIFFQIFWINWVGGVLGESSGQKAGDRRTSVFSMCPLMRMPEQDLCCDNEFVSILFFGYSTFPFLHDSLFKNTAFLLHMLYLYVSSE